MVFFLWNLFTPSCWISYVLEEKIRGRGPSSCNQINDILVIDLYLWLTLTPVLKDGKFYLLLFHQHIIILSTNKKLNSRLCDLYIFFWKCIKCLDTKICWCTFITHLNKILEWVKLVLNLTHFVWKKIRSALIWSKIQRVLNFFFKVHNFLTIFVFSVFSVFVCDNSRNWFCI